MTNTPQPLLMIQGLTATGKSSLAELIAQVAISSHLYKGAVLIGADSRQVYQGLEILSGADLPQKAHSCFEAKNDQIGAQALISTTNHYRYFLHPTLPLEYHGLSIIRPDQIWSVAHFVNLAREVIKTSWHRQFLPIVVGGTSFYHQQLVKPQASLIIKPNQTIRQQADMLSLIDLQKWLIKLNPTKFNTMNHSDQNNPRRLVRAIEIEEIATTTLKTTTKNISKQTVKQSTIQPSVVVVVAPTFDLAQIQKFIIRRVETRLKQGVLEEIKTLLQWQSLSPLVTSATGFMPIKNYLDNLLKLSEAKTVWITQENQYAKRQATWLKKFPPQLWLEINNNDQLSRQISSLLTTLGSN